MSEENKTSFADLDWKDTEKFQRGDTPEDIRTKTLEMCRDFLGGSWTKISAEEIVLRRISGGMTNQMYYCALPDGCEPEAGEPKEVAFRLYGKRWVLQEEDQQPGSERLNDAIIAVLMSDAKIGPTIYGVSALGELQEYVESHPFFEAEENDSAMVKELAKKLAQIHYLNPPFKKPKKDFHILDKFYKKFEEKCSIEDLKKLELDDVLKIDLKAEVDLIKKMIMAMKTPFVLAHSDFRNSNILVRVKPKDNDKLRICDFEYTKFGYRGHDLSTLFRTWGHTKVDVKQELPPDDVMTQFFEFYLEECVKIKGDTFLEDPVNSVDNLIKETKVFFWSGFMFGILMQLSIDMTKFDPNEFKHIKFDEKQFLKRINMSANDYLFFKEKFKQEGVFPEV